MKIRHPHTGPDGQGIDGKLQIAVENDAGETTGEIVEFPIVAGVMDVPDQHVAHVLAGLHGSAVITDE